MKCYRCHKEEHYRKDCPKHEEDGSHSIEENEESDKQQYSIARNRSRKEIRPPQKYVYASMVAYAPSVAEGIEVGDPVTYKKKAKSMELALWTVVMSEEMESLTRIKLVALYDLELEQLNVKIAFLLGELEEQIFTSPPEGFVIQGKEDHVCLLKKSLYGLKQSPR
ncbi:hypothetical protein RJ639_014494 [Escallonia herrerae]|uniref:CCHC-type domain-containing protein n=1 Tax=Escallonia herrerae TaxID=1293975 RepID=A0AA89ANK0_9ASTE|nr:hypothetical protein RJ639_014494 [Escallonia herrerae]